MTELVVTRGLPGSGKTTWARLWVAEDPERRARINRDDLRAQLFDAAGPAYLGYFKRAGLHRREQAVTAAERGAAIGLLEAGYSVVVDATNIRTRYVRAWRELAGELGAEFAIKDLTDVALDDCVRNDMSPERVAEGRWIGEEAVRNMHARMVNTLAQERDADNVNDDGWRYVPDPDLPRAVIVDIDGTIALRNGRSPYDLDRVMEDLPNEPVIEVVRQLAREHLVLVVSGREGTAQCKQDTMQWLDHHGVPWSALNMRAEGDRRDDAVVKREILRDELASRYHVVGVLDDRNRVVRMWRRLGLLCMQVAPGAF